MALLGLGLVHLVADPEPDDLLARELRDAVARWAIGVAVGFLRLFPLQATPVEDLPQSITNLQGPWLNLTASRPSPPVLKEVLSERLETSLKSSKEIINSPLKPNLWAIILPTIRVMLLAVVYAKAFAAGSQRTGSAVSLLSEAQILWDLRWPRWADRRREGLEAGERQHQQQVQNLMEALALTGP